MHRKIFNIIAVLGTICLSSIANAHIIDTNVNVGNSFITGFIHPLHGLDHLLAMLAVGLWAGQHQNKTVVLAPLTFIFFMLTGWILGVNHVHLPLTEHFIMMSLIVFGSLIALSIKTNTYLAMAIIGIFAIYHGYAHGLEMSITASALKYTAGFVAATAMLHIIGIIIAKICLAKNKMYLSKISGGGVIAAGIALFCLQ